MSWLAAALTSYFILAIVGIVDKFLLSSTIKDNRLYTFLIGMLGMLVFAAIPFIDFTFPGLWGFSIDIISGVFLIAALFLFYKALQTGEASVVIPLIGGGMPIVVFLISYLVLGRTFTSVQLLAVLLLLIGSILMTLIPREKARWWEFWKKKKPRSIGVAIASTVFFSIFFLLSEYAYAAQGFAIGFIWARLGSFLAVFWLILNKSFQKSLKQFFKHFISSKKYLFFVNQTFGAAAFAGQGYAISLKGAAIINALQGAQYVFLLIFASIISILFPKLIKEQVSRVVILEKSFAILFIVAGVYLIAR